ncbi:hypothetical protein SH1V18_34550 [Vallitalea longa]|uniref:Uncharacterized protein n=1 Tax=Vallitalea longa TaxID=2936439 RepID=A0A9W6DFV5_9FIRM|nr:hypothetical protein [Vallitalea longa]GKX30975.1 hypothetical protein SH1V18_34550 [Vallitalea longa]
MTNQIESSLVKVAKALNNAEIQWAVGASLMLQSLDLVEEVHDIDIIVALPDIEKAINVLEHIAVPIPIPKKDEYVTHHFYTFNIDGVDMDVMSGFRIRHCEGIYDFLLDNSSIVRTEHIDGTKIPYTSLEDWYVAYMLMIGREWKVKIIRDYFEKKGVNHPELLKRILEQKLPEEVTTAIVELLEA